MLDPIAYFHDRIGEPIGRWFQTRGFRVISLAFTYLFGLAVAATSIGAILWVAYDLIQ